MENNGPLPNTAFQSWADAQAQDVRRLLAVPGADQPPPPARIAKYIRCNGSDDLRQALQEYRVTIKAGGGANVRDGWGYIVQIANQRWVRAQRLYLLLGLYEHSLRSRTDGLLIHHLGRRWWTSLDQYMSADNGAHLLITNVNVRSHPPTDDAPVPAMRNFQSGSAFLRSLNLSELHSIVTFLWDEVFKHAFLPPPGKALKRSWIDNAFATAEVSRNEVMHCRPINQRDFPDKARLIKELLHCLEWDPDQALANIAVSADVMGT